MAATLHLAEHDQADTSSGLEGKGSGEGEHKAFLMTARGGDATLARNERGVRGSFAAEWLV